MAGDAGLVLACAGCCCGHPDSGGPKTPPRVLKAATRRLFRKSGLDGRVRLAFTDCLGPCSEANVIFFYALGRPYWFRRINSPELIAAPDRLRPRGDGCGDEGSGVERSGRRGARTPRVHVDGGWSGA